MRLNLDTASVLSMVVDPDNPKAVQSELMSAASIYQEVDDRLCSAVAQLRLGEQDPTMVDLAKTMVAAAMATAYNLGWTRKRLGSIDLERLALIQSAIESLSKTGHDPVELKKLEQIRRQIIG